MTLALALCGLAAAQARWEGGYGVPAVDPLDDVGIERLDALFRPPPPKPGEIAASTTWWCWGDPDHSWMWSAVWSHHAEAIRHCYEVALRRDPGLSGRLTVTVVLQAGENIAHGVLTTSDLHDPLLEDCVVSVLDFVAFDVPSGQQHTTYVVHYPIRFHPSTEP